MEDFLGGGRATHINVSIRIDFPALENFVCFLMDQRDQQRQVDALAEQVNQTITKPLHESGEALAEAVTTAPGNAKVNTPDATDRTSGGASGTSRRT